MCSDEMGFHFRLLPLLLRRFVICLHYQTVSEQQQLVALNYQGPSKGSYSGDSSE